jgi:hypothetical protein
MGTDSLFALVYSAPFQVISEIMSLSSAGSLEGNPPLDLIEKAIVKRAPADVSPKIRARRRVA